MSKLTDLMRLMAKLSKTEKRYLTIGVGQLIEKKKANTTALQLFARLNDNEFFTAISENQQKLKGNLAEKERQESEFLKQWAKRSLKGLTGIAPVNKLSRIVLDLLIQYHQDEPEYRIDRLIHEARVHFNKGLYLQALRIIVKAKEEAKKYEVHLKIFEALLLEKSIRTNILASEADYEKIEELRSECSAELGQLEDLIKVLADRELLLCWLRVPDPERSFGPEDYNKLSELTRNTIDDISSSVGFSVEVRMHLLFNATLYYSHFLSTNKTAPQLGGAKALVYRRAIYELFRSNPASQEYRPQRFTAIKHIYLRGTYENNKLDEAEIIILEEEVGIGIEWEGDEIKKINRIVSEAEFRSVYYVTIFYLRTNNYLRLGALIETTDEWLLSSKIRIDNRVILLLTFSLVALLLKDYYRIPKYLDQLRKIHNVNKRRDYVLIDILEIIYLFESEKISRLELITQVEQFISTNTRRKEDHKEAKIASLIISSIYALLNKEKAYPEAQRNEASQRPHRISEYQTLSAILKQEGLVGTIFSDFPIWLNNRIQAMEQK